MNTIAYQLNYILGSLGYRYRIGRSRSTPSHIIVSVYFPIGERITELFRRMDEFALYLGVEELEVKQRAGYMDFIIPREDREILYLTDILKRIESHNSKILEKELSFPLGLDQDNKIRITSLSQPETCQIGIVGQSGSGKTVSLKGIIYTLAKYHTPEDIKFLICDPTDSLDIFNGLPHLIGEEIASSQEDIEKAINYAIGELEHRYQHKIRDSYALILIIDETATALNQNPSLIDKLQFIVSNGRKYNTHLILSSQKFSDKYFKGSSVLLSNIGLKLIFRVANSTDSGILEAGLKANKLLGAGDCYAIATSTERVQFPYISDEEIIEFIEEQEQIIKYENSFEVAEKTNYSLCLVKGGREKDNFRWDIERVKEIPKEIWTYLQNIDGVSVRELEKAPLPYNRAIEIRRALGKIEGLLGAPPDGKSPAPINKEILQEILSVITDDKIASSVK